jgi:hypothetical protein
MLTGDNKETAQKIASALNIPEFRAELKPEDKAEIVKEYQKKIKLLHHLLKKYPLVLLIQMEILQQEVHSDHLLRRLTN